ncbi:MAG: EAL domain-containing protein [Actinomycetota bacterium]|nr:EAL domain-containing protein [Actinomycetota bacterium]
MTKPAREAWRRFGRSLLAAFLAVGLFGAWLLADPGSAWIDRVVSDVSFVVSPLVAGWSCLRAAGRGGPRGRGWRFMAAAAFTWALAGAVWSFYELVLRRFSPFPSPADVGFIGYSVPAAIALFAFPGGSSRLVSRFRAGLDGAAIASAVLFVSWTSVLGPVYRAGGEDLLSRLVGLAYPVADVVMVSLVLGLGMRRQPGARLPWVVLGGGLLTLAVTDSVYVNQAFGPGYEPGTILDLGWTAAFLLVAVATQAPTAMDDPAGANGERRLSLLQEAIPYVPFVGALVVSTRQRIDFADDPFLFLNAIAVLVLFGIRQVAILLESISLTNDLERTVERRTSELISQEQWFQSLVQHSSDVVLVVGRDGSIRYRSPSIQSVLGYPPEEVPDHVGELTHPADHDRVLGHMATVGAQSAAAASFEARLRHRDGSWRQMDAVAASLTGSGGDGGVVLNMRDVTDRKRLEEELRRKAFYDSLTGLANRALFHDRLAKAIQVAMRRGASPAVLMVDLDGFKEVNDTLGHGVGDRLLQLMAERIGECLRPSDTAARVGGDEFAVLLEDTSRSGAESVAERLVVACRQPVLLGDREVVANASIGIAFWSPEMRENDAVLQCADAAMYSAKVNGGNHSETYDEAVHASVRDRLELAADLRRCLDRGELELHYQPIVATDSGRIMGLEALVRWQHPRHGLIPPDRFIPVAEQTGMITSLGRWVLDTACRQALEWQRRHPRHPPLYVSVNLSTRQIRQSGLVAEVDRILADSGLDPGCLVLEITETALVSDFEETIDNLHRLKELGVKLSIDDFGTGYSSLTYLRRLPVEVVKIDRSFVAGIATSPDEWSLAVAIVKLVKALSLSTVAEGVESAAQLAHLRALGCEFAQGYYFARPQPAPAIDEMLAASDDIGPARGAGRPDQQQDPDAGVASVT